MYRLIFLNGAMKGRRVAVKEGSIVIGRDPSCHLAIADDPEVATRHVTIEERQGSHYLCGFRDSDRLLLNDQPVLDAALKNNDRIEIGRTQLEFQLVIDQDPAGARRRSSGFQALALACVGLIVLAELYFVVIAPLRQKTPVFDEEKLAKARAIARAEKAREKAPAPPPVVTNDAETAEARKLIEAMAAASNAAPSVTFTSPVPEVAVSPPDVPDKPPTNVAAAAPPVGLPDAIRAAMTADITRVTMPEQPDIAADDLLLGEARRMLQAALERAATGDYARAERMLDCVQVMAPDFVDAYAGRAGVLEQLGRYRDAFAQWQQVEKLARGTPRAAEAKTEQMRMVQREKEAQAAPPKPAADTPGSGRVRIVSVERERFQSSRDYDEMRVIRINLRARRGEPVTAEDVLVLVTFYDRNEDTGGIAPTRAVVPADVLRIEGRWPENTAKSVTATYTVPRDFRAEELRLHTERRTYNGYRIQVFHKGELADEDASPKDLLELPAPRLPPPAADMPVSR